MELRSDMQVVQDELEQLYKKLDKNTSYEKFIAITNKVDELEEKYYRMSNSKDWN